MSSLLKIRGGHRAIVTKHISLISSLFGETQVDLVRIKAILCELQGRQKQLEDLNLQIQGELDDEDLMRDMNESDERMLAIRECIIRSEQSLRDIEAADDASHRVRASHLDKVVRLPTLNLPDFDGNPLNWQSFWDIFRVSVHDRQDLTGAQKFTYLRGQLKKEALQLLVGFTTTDLQYQEAVCLLRSTYGKPYKITQAHLHALFELEVPKATSLALSRFHAGYESHLRGLVALGADVNAAGFVIAELLLRKLPARIKDNINRAQKTDRWDLESFRSAIEAEICLLQAVEPQEKFHAEKGSMRSLNSSKSFMKETKSSASTFIVKASKDSCLFCQQRHNHYFCTLYRNPKDRYQQIMKSERCLNCLAEGHKRADCSSTNRCKNCRGSHHTLLCFKSVSNEESRGSNAPVASNSSEALFTSAVASSKDPTSDGVALPVAMITLCHRWITCTIRALFDQGSQRTFILRSVVRKLQLISKKSIQLTIDGFASRGTYDRYDIVQVDVRTNAGVGAMEAIVVETLPSRINMPGLMKAVAYLRSINVPLTDYNLKDDNIQDIGILIGADQYYNFVTGFKQYGTLQVLESTVGGMMTGKLPCQGLNVNCKPNSGVVTVLNIGTNCSFEEDSISDRYLQRLWELDSIGICHNAEKVEDNDVLKSFEDTISYSNGHYVAKLPWKTDHPPLQSNYSATSNRLQSLLKKLRRNPDRLAQYHGIIMNQLERGFIESVDPAKELHPEAKVFYIPHHGVEKESATTPLRIVFDCSAGHPSLNACLFSGPVLMHELCQILLRFRLGRYVCITDIEKAFLQVVLYEGDRDSRFLWPQNPEDPTSEVIQYRFRVVLFGATCSQFLLNATIRYHLQRNECEVSTAILRNVYVDNFHFSNHNEETLVEFYRNAKQVMREAGFNLREWATNSSLLREEIAVIGDGNDTGRPMKYMGMKWFIQEDKLGFAKSTFSKGITTKRSVVSDVGRLFDPLGLLNPITIRARIFIQELWLRKFGWDDPLSDELSNVWRDIISQMTHGSTFQFPRCLTLRGSLTIHGFCDASSKAYGTAIYVSDGNVSQLVMSKVKVAPIKQLTIPQMELTAATLAARLITYVINAYLDELHFDSIICWSDSMIVLYWIQNGNKSKPYVHNRVSEIKTLLPTATWRYVGTKENIADILTRGISSEALSTRWVDGPQWLCHKELWPPEALINEGDSTAVVCETMAQCSDEPTFLIDVSRFSSFRKLLHVAVLVGRFVAILLKRTNRKCSLNDHKCTVLELEDADLSLLKQVQAESFKPELNWLQKPEGSKAPNLVRQLRLFMENGVIRCKQRIDHSELPYDSRYPILVPRKHDYTKLLILDAHERLGHIGVSATLNHLRQHFWIPHMRQTVKYVIGRCLKCKHFIVKHYVVPPSPPLPSSRVREARPFEVTGVDYTGALLVRDDGMRKVYVCLFTCAVTRAIHLELAIDLSAVSFLQMFKRFIGRRSCPRIMYSDNAKNFSAASDFLKKIRSHPEIQSSMNRYRCEWRLIPSYAPWMGGFWERLIGMTKDVLRRILGRSLISLEEMRTIIVEIESIINDRPITWVSDSLDDDTALTPSQLLYGFRLTDLPVPNEELETAGYFERPLLNSRQKHMEKLKRHFWRRWHNEYLLLLNRSRKEGKTADSNVIEIGDIVLIHDPNANQLHWKLGRVQKLYKGQDGFVRSAQVKSSHGFSNRAITSLYPLELRAESTSHSPDIGVEGDTTSRPPARKAAQAARNAFRNQF